MIIIYIIFIACILFLIIVNAVKIGVKEALREFKDEIVEEFNLKPVQKLGPSN
ncbi:MAG: hypothetical protein GX359_08795, partial [Clostridiales bacterium]|nr:hypothetical protein [Clostridiales bacterium]